MTFRITVCCVGALAALSVADAAHAQYLPSVPAYPGAAAPAYSDADALAAAMRRLGANPRDLDALITASELSLRVGDSAAAAALLARADRIDPRNGRVKAGMGALLVRAERPGEALRYFDQAEGFGVDVRRYAADRGLAYDLIGENDRAQRDYRLALRATDDAETRRRYALSLGISGKRDAALAEIDALLRKSDRGAWRARAFILAMTGDAPGAAKIAQNMMPGGMAQAMQPFFTRLATMRPADRAFAVHFGELMVTAARVADARMTPALRPLGPDPYAPRVAVAAVLPTLRDRARDRRRARREEARREDDGRRGRQRTRTEVAARGERAPQHTTRRAAEPVRSTQDDPGTRLAFAAARRREATAAVLPTPRLPTPPPLSRLVFTYGAPRAEYRLAPFVWDFRAATPPSPVALAALTIVDRTPVTLAASNIPPASGPSSVRPDVAAATPPAATSRPIPASAAPPTLASTVTTVSPTTSESSIIAGIVASLGVPASELGIAPAPVASISPAPVAATPPPMTNVLATTQTAPVPVAPAPATPDPAAVAAAEVERLRLVEERRVAAAKKAADARALAAKKAADEKKALAVAKAADAKKTLATKKAADEKKLLAAKKIADEKKRAEADAPRIWVQVAGGANESDLPKAWAAAQSKAPALKGRQGWSTPLRATNRVATGPFKTEAEAQTFINQLARQGLTAFAFTSAKGQKLTRLAAR